MKKTYNIPAIKVVKVKPARIMAGSISRTNVDLDRKGNTSGRIFEAGARGASFSTWEDED